MDFRCKKCGDYLDSCDCFSTDYPVSEFGDEITFEESASKGKRCLACYFFDCKCAEGLKKKSKSKTRL